MRFSVWKSVWKCVSATTAVAANFSTRMAGLHEFTGRGLGMTMHCDQAHGRATEVVATPSSAPVTDDRRAFNAHAAPIIEANSTVSLREEGCSRRSNTFG